MRKLGLISSLWAALFLFPLAGFALGLGEIETSSFLNQPLKAEIQVNSARPGEIDDLLISLASRDAFNKAGLERPAGLSKLKFKVDKSEDGQTARILVTTKTAIKEPFLSFLVEADWAKGRLLREFTVLLDPMSFAQQAVQAPQVTAEQPATSKAAEMEPVASESTSTRQPVAESQGSPRAIASPIATSSESSSTEQQVPYVADNEYLSSAASVDQIVVSKGDTLWGIAAQFKDDNHSMAQVMLAMQMMNPDAFGKDNINNLKVGAVLRVPDMDVMDRLSKQEAYAQVLDQNGLWDEYVARKSGSTSAAMADSSTGIESSQQETDSQLSLVTADEGDSDSASLQNDANSENAGQIRKQLALAEEELEAARLENDDLLSRIEMLEQQQSKFEELQKLVQIQDNSLAQLQQSTAESDVEVVEEAMTEQVIEENVVTEEIIEEKPSEVMIEAAGDMLAEDSMQEDSTEQTEMASTDGMMEEEQSTEAETVLPTAIEGTDEMLAEEQESQAEFTTVPVPVIVDQVPETSIVDEVLNMLPSMDQLLNDPVMLGGIGGFLVLLLGLVLLKRKKSTKEDEGITIEESDGLLDEDATPIHIPTTTQVSVDEDESLAETAVMESEQDLVETIVSEADKDDEDDEFSATAIISADDMPTAEEEPVATQEEQDDVLNEVDVYLAYGLYDNAEDLLTESLQSSPDRADYRAKLLDTYFATKNKDSFVKEAEMLKSLGGAADRFWVRIQTMGFELVPDNELFSGAKDSGVSVEDLEYAKPESADFDIGSDDDVTDFSNTDFNFENDSFEISATQAMDIPEDNDFSETQNLDALDIDFPDLVGDSDESSSDEVVSNDLPDEIAIDELELEDDLGEDFNIGDELGGTEKTDVVEDLSIDDEVETSDETVEAEIDIDLDSDEDDISFDLPDDMDISSEGEDDAYTEIIDLEPTVEAPTPLDEVPPMDEDGLEFNDTESLDFGLDELDIGESDELDISEIDEIDDVNETLVLSPEELEAETEKAEETKSDEVESDDIDVEIPFDEDLDFNMSDMGDDSLQSGEFTPSDTVALTNVSLDAGDLEVDSSEDDITEFRPADSTGEYDAFIAQATDEAAIDEAAIVEVDLGAGLDKTGTFAPGDFTEETTAIAEDSDLDVDGIDEIEGLMLPDDVDEVGTKLDLAKAFIDMGDAEGARSSLEEVLTEGTDDQKAEATGLLDQIN